MQRKRIAVTGGIGSGKSTVLSYLKEKGYAVFSCDEIYRTLLKTEEYIRAIAAAFPDVIDGCGIDKEKLAELVFNDKRSRDRLNAIAHPWIMQRLFQEMEQSNSRVCFAEVPLLFENGFEKDFDATLVVLREKNIRIQSVIHRDGQSQEQVEGRIHAQFDYDAQENQTFLRKENVHVIYNNDNKNALYEKIDEYLLQL